MVYSWGKYDLSTVTVYRYIDWMITTPSMLITLMAFLGGSETQSLSSFISEHRQFISTVLSLNMLMLLFGLAGEMNQIPQKKAVALGFVPFVLYFGLIYHRFIYPMVGYKLQLFYYFLVVWSLYGMVALLQEYGLQHFGFVLKKFARNLLICTRNQSSCQLILCPLTET